MRLKAYMAMIVACAAGAVLAADPKPAPKMEEPMAGKMRKPGMKQGDVKQAAQKKRRDMKPKLEQEEKQMPRQPK